MLYSVAGERIMKLREMNHYSRDEFADMVGITSKFLYEIETGRKGFSAKTLCQISSALGVSNDYILTGYDRDKRSADVTMEMIEQFDVEQRGRLQSILASIYDMCKRS